MDGGRPVTQYDVLAWMQTRKRMIKKKEERQAALKEQSRSMHQLPQGHGAQLGQQQHGVNQVGWHPQQPFLVQHASLSLQHAVGDAQHAPMQVEGDVGQPPLTPGAGGGASLSAGVSAVMGVVGGMPSQAGGLVAPGMVAKQQKMDRIKRPRMDYNDAQVFRLVQAYESGEKQVSCTYPF